MATKGLTSLMVVGILAVVAVLGFALTLMMTPSRRGDPEQVDYEKAAFLNQAGLEYAMRKIYRGENPVTGDRPLGDGTFRVARQGETLAVMSRVGGSAVTHQATQPTQAECLGIHTSESHTHDRGRQIRRIYLTKNCLESILLDRMTLSWDPNLGETYDQVTVEGLPHTHLYEAPPRVRSNQLIDLRDAPLTRNQRYKLSEIRFQVDIRPKSFHLSFLMGDGSRKEVQFTLGPCPHSSC